MFNGFVRIRPCFFFVIFYIPVGNMPSESLPDAAPEAGRRREPRGLHPPEGEQTNEAKFRVGQSSLGAPGTSLPRRRRYLVEAQRVEAQRVEAQHVEVARVEAQHVEVERLEVERLEAARLEAERLEAGDPSP